MCPMSLQDLDLNFQQTLKDTVDRIPSIAYQIPNLDGVARLEVIDKSNSVVACVEAPLSNGQTVLHPAVGWTCALIFLLTLLISNILSGGYPAIAAHVGAHAAVLLGYFQSVAMIAMISVPLPPLVSAWAGNFIWTLGIVRVDFGSGFCIAAAYGFDPIYDTVPEPSHVPLWKRTNRDATLDASPSSGIIKVTGIARMAYLAKIETTNIFMTGFSFFVALLFATVVIVVGFRLCLAGKGKDGNWSELKRNWKIVLKGAVLKLFWMALPMILLLAPYELSHISSPAATTLAVFFLLSSLGLIFLATFRILRLPTSQLILDPEVWAKYGGVYGIFLSPGSEPDRSTPGITAARSNIVGFNSSSSAAEKKSHHSRRLSKSSKSSKSSNLRFLHTQKFLLILLPIIILKPLLTATLQSHGLPLVILLLILDLIFLVAVSMGKPFLDRRISMLAIAIATVGVINAVLALIWGLGSNDGAAKATDGATEPKGATVPDYVKGVAGVVFVIINLVWLIVLLCMVVAAGIRGVMKRKTVEAAGRGVDPTGVMDAARRRDLEEDITDGTLGMGAGNTAPPQSASSTTHPNSNYNYNYLNPANPAHQQRHNRQKMQMDVLDEESRRHSSPESEMGDASLKPYHGDLVAPARPL
ncbi:hypothetical protein BZA77DRAFT_357575 [Pyronema omphalodes]|nr:hypothetical protein BZA77DRAFT_357575 [Pyronema omphalodes]